MATRHIYVLKRNGFWGTSDWKDGNNLKQSEIQSLEGTVRMAEHQGYNEQSKGHEYIIYIELPDGTFSFHRRSPGAIDDIDANQIGDEDLRIPD